jgi:hypothetical protein
MFKLRVCDSFVVRLLAITTAISTNSELELSCCKREHLREYTEVHKVNKVGTGLNLSV